MAQGKNTDDEASVMGDSFDFIKQDKKEPLANNHLSSQPGNMHSRESMIINEAFSFLPENDKAPVSSVERTSCPLIGHENDTSDDRNDDYGIDNQKSDDNSDKSGNEVQMRDGNDHKMCASRLISMEFKFLSIVNENDGESEDIATCDDARKDPEENLSGNSASNSVGSNSSVVMHQKSDISSQGTRQPTVPMSSKSSENDDSNSSDDNDEEENDDVNINPGAWPKSKFVYVADASDTASEGSMTDSARSSPSPRRRHCLSIYPSETAESKNCVDDSDVFEPGNNQDTKSTLSSQRSDSISTTASEQEFCSYYRSLKKTSIMMKSSCRKAAMLKQQPIYVPNREVHVKMEEGEAEFGFHVWGRNPLIISTVNAGSAAERAGLQVGDVVLRMNNIDISEASVQEVLEIIGKGVRQLTLSLPEENLKSEVPLFCGYLKKLSGSVIMKQFRRRWFELRCDGCLYYYKNQWDVDPLGAIPVVNYAVTRAKELKSSFAFKLTRCHSKTYYFMAESESETARWADAIRQAGEMQCENNIWLDISSHNVSLPALSIHKPECYGYLYKLGGRNKNWRYRYCILKDGCLYYYENMKSPKAKGVVHFHGYEVDDSIQYNKQYSFKLVPPEENMRTFYFYAENETEKNRWMKAFTGSLSRWIMVAK